MALNRYAKLRRHKRYLKQRHANAYCRWNVHDDERKCKEDFEEDKILGSRFMLHDLRNNGYRYWRNYYLSGTRKFAKESTNRKIRAKYRDLIRNKPIEYLSDVPAPQGSDYEKEFDYFWTLW